MYLPATAIHKPKAVVLLVVDDQLHTLRVRPRWGLQVPEQPRPRADPKEDAWAGTILTSTGVRTVDAKFFTLPGTTAAVTRYRQHMRPAFGPLPTNPIASGQDVSND